MNKNGHEYESDLKRHDENWEYGGMSYPKPVEVGMAMTTRQVRGRRSRKPMEKMPAVEAKQPKKKKNPVHKNKAGVITNMSTKHY